MSHLPYLLCGFGAGALTMSIVFARSLCRDVRAIEADEERRWQEGA